MTIGWAILISTALWILWRTGVLTNRVFWQRTAKVILTVGVFFASFAGTAWWYDAHPKAARPDPVAGLPSQQNTIPPYAVPRQDENGPVDCYDAQGNLAPDESKAFGGYTVACAPGETPEPATYRNQIPEAKKARAERIEACWQSVEDRHGDKADFDKCVTDNPKETR